MRWSRIQLRLVKIWNVYFIRNKYSDFDFFPLSWNMQPKYLWKDIQNDPYNIISAGNCPGLGSPQDKYSVYTGKKTVFEI